MTLDRGTVVLVELDPTVGHEQRGLRPCVAVSDPAVNADQRFPLIAVVPVTGTAGVGALYPALSPIEHRDVRIESMDRGLDGSGQAGRRHCRADVQHADASRHIQHVLIEVSDLR